ncbi:MAG: ATP-binding protein [Lachnospiraceae bacterium]
MSRVLCCMLVVFYLLPMTAYAAEHVQKTVRVGYVWSTNFSEGNSDEEYKSGYAYEYLQKLSYYTGWDYEYVYGDWATILDMLSKGEVDIMAGLSRTKERVQTINFPDYPMGAEGYYIYVWQNSELAGLGVEGLNGITIGCTEGSMQNIFLKKWNEENGNPVIIKTFGGNIDMYKEFAAHHIDAVVDTDIAILPTDGLVPLAKVGTSDYYLGVAKERIDLLEDLNPVLEEIDRTTPYYLQNLHNKYFSETAVGTTLSEIEKQWLNEHSVLRVGHVENYMPLCGVNEDGQTEGMIVDIFSALFEKLSLDSLPVVEYHSFVNQSDLIKAVSNGSVDVAFPIYGDIWFSETQGLFQTTDIMELDVDIVYRGDFSNLKIQKIGVNQNNLLQYQYCIGQYPEAEIVYFDSIEACLEAVAKGKIDCTIMNSLRTNPLTNKEYYKGLNSYQIPKSFHMTMGVRKGESGLLTLLNHGLDTLDKNYALSSTYKYQKDVYTYTAKDFIWDNILWIILIIMSVTAVLLFFILRDSKRTKKYLAQEKEMTKGLEDALAAAQSANRAKTIFLNNMSHDMRTPMNAIIGFANIAKKQQDRKEVDKCLDKIASSSDHLLSLINDVLDISRIEGGAVSCNLLPTNICSVTESVLSIIQGYLVNRDLTLVVKRPQQEGHCCVLIDGVHLREILVNIFGNAVKFTDDGGTITFSMGKNPGCDDNHVIIWYSISDTGCGMSEEFLPHVFEEFSQEDNGARTKYKGTGLGMSITKHYVEMMGGTISVDSKKGQGSTFTIEIPVEIVKDNTLSDTLEQPVNMNLLGKKALLVEDNELNAEIATVQLEEVGMKVTWVQDGEQAVETFKTSASDAFDVILMDIMMPRMNGYEATRAIRSMESGRSIPIIAMTANAFAEDVQASLDAGMNAHIAKPLVMDEVLKTISRMI